MDLRQLRAFCEICAEGGFSAAAAKLHLTQSALSHQIRLLEEELGQELLVRAKPKVYPTAAGLLLLESSHVILSEVAHVRANFGMASEPAPRPLVRIAATNVGLCYLYGSLCEGFLRDRPDVDLTIYATESIEDALQRVSRRFADIAFTTLPIEIPNIDVVELGSVENIFIVGPRHPLASRAAVEPEGLLASPFVRFLPGSGMRFVSDKYFAEAGRYPPILTETNDAELVKRLISMGTAAALIPVFAVVSEIRSHRLIALKMRGAPLLQRFGFAVRSGTGSVALERFKAACLKRTRKWPKTISLDSVRSSRWPLP
jgi:DNA-binding transcriptional LysR family regulator